MLESILIIVVKEFRAMLKVAFLKSKHQNKSISADVIYDQANIGLESLNEIIKITLAF